MPKLSKDKLRKLLAALREEEEAKLDVDLEVDGVSSQADKEGDEGEYEDPSVDVETAEDIAELAEAFSAIRRVVDRRRISKLQEEINDFFRSNGIDINEKTTFADGDGAEDETSKEKEGEVEETVDELEEALIRWLVEEAEGEEPVEDEDTEEGDEDVDLIESLLMFLEEDDGDDEDADDEDEDKEDSEEDEDKEEDVAEKVEEALSNILGFIRQ